MDQAAVWDTKVKFLMQELFKVGGIGGANLKFSLFKTDPAHDPATALALTATVTWNVKDTSQSFPEIPFFHILLAAHCRNSKDLLALIKRFHTAAADERTLSERAAAGAGVGDLARTEVLARQKEVAEEFAKSEGGFEKIYQHQLN